MSAPADRPHPAPHLLNTRICDLCQLWIGAGKKPTVGLCTQHNEATPRGYVCSGFVDRHRAEDECQKANS